MARKLGRVQAPDDRHIRLFSISEETLPEDPTPVCIGVNWYSAFDDPVQDSNGVYWVGRGKPETWGRIRGGHEICLKPPLLRDLDGWWRFYNQGAEGACVGFALSRMMSLLNRRRYDARWLYWEAQRRDDWSGGAYPGATQFYEGTTGRAGCEVLRENGHRRILRGESLPVSPEDGIQTFRWVRTIEDVAAALNPADGGRGILNRGYVVPLNSWGDDPNNGYPHLPRMPIETAFHLLFREDGDGLTVTDR